MAVGELAGQTLAGRYEVLDLIGSGGMGEVYRARDRELDDVIALKVVRSDLLAWPDVLARFRREVKLARRVTHANVARAFELVIADGVTFYTMELVEGMPLARRLAAGRRLPVGEAAAIAVALCDALAAAHDAGIVHRDVKPANVLIGDGGRIVLTDFGIAEASLAELDTRDGTPRFMAPEQARGEAPTPAADLYALGVVLYEMLTGLPAFTGSPAEILEAKQRTEHLAVGGVDPRLAELIASATHRDVGRRPRSAHELRRALAPFAPGAPGAGREAPPSAEPSLRRASPIPTVTVRAASAPAAVDHLAKGFHQAFVDRLAQWPRLRVVPCDAAEPDRAVIVETSVAHDGELALAATARPASLVLRLPFDAESLPRSVEQAARIVAVLAGSDVAPPPAGPMVATPPQALELILRARYEARRGRATLPAGVARCERALALAPGDPRVLAALATCQAQLAFYSPDDSERLLADAAVHALAALAAAPELAEAHFARAHVELHSGRPVIAAVCFRAAISRAPLMAEAHEWLGRMLLEAGFLVDAIARLEDTLATDSSPVLRWDLASARALAGQWDEVDRIIAELAPVEIDAGFGYRLRFASWRGDRATEAEGIAMLSRLGERSFERSVLRMYEQDRPWPERREALLSLLGDRQPASTRRRAFLAQLAAEVAGRAGDVETCLMALLRANAEGLFDLHWLDRCPLLASVRAEPRFAVIRADVARRAEAIHDALYSDHRDQATVATAVGTS